MAGYGQFTGYEPNPEIPGAYNFARENGPPLTFGGGEAEQLKARLDAYNSVNQPQVAGPGGAPLAAPEYQPDAAPAAMAPAPPPQPALPPAQGGGLKPFAVNGINTGYVQDASGQLLERVGGTAGVSKEQLEKKAGEGVVMPTAQSNSVSGGFRPDEEYQSNRALAGDVERGALDQARGAEMQAEMAGREVAQQQFAAQTGQMDKQRALIDQVQAQVNEAQMRRDQALKDYSSAKVDPDKIFRGVGGTVDQFAKTIGVAMGAFAATTGKTQNFAQQIVDAQIARSIAAQEADIRIKKDKSDTALGDLMRRGMTLDQAKGTLGTIQRDWAKNQISLARGASANDAINAKYDSLIGKFDKDQMDEAEAYRQKSLGTATQAVQAQIVHPQAGSAGGYRPVAPGKALSIAGTTASTEGQVAGTAKTIGELQGGGKKTEGDQKALASLATVRTSLKALDSYKDDDVAQIPDNQNVAARAYHGAKDFVLGAGASARDMSNRDRSLIQDTEAAKGHVKALTSVLSGQGALSGPEAEVAERGLAPSATVGDIKRALATVEARAQAIAAAGGVPTPAAQVPK